jgi:hypothetical protein
VSGAEERRLKSYAIVDAPPHLGLRSAGVEQLPGALLGPGFAKRLAARLPPPPYESRNDPETWMLNPTGLRDYPFVVLPVEQGATMRRGLTRGGGW